MQDFRVNEFIGVGAGEFIEDASGRRIPIVMITFPEDEQALDDLSNDVFDPSSDSWSKYAMTIRGARQLISDLQEAIDIAIQGDLDRYAES